MLRSLKHRASDREGFTLVEVLVVASIIGILAAIAIPSLTGSRKSALQAACVKSLRSITDAQEMHYRDTFTYTDDWTRLDEYLPSAYSTYARKHFFITNYSLALETAAQAQRYTVSAFPTDASLRLQTFRITQDSIPLYENYEPAQ